MENTEMKRKEAQVTETQEEQESVLDSIMKNVTLADPLEIPLKSGQILTIKQEQFIEYYLPPDASRVEKANCFNEVKVAGLNPAIRGDCHFFRTQGQPMHLFIGYHVYLRHAYTNGLIHIHKPEIEFGDDGHPFSCTITLEIEGRPEFEWETIFWEVASTTRDGKLNARWEKAPVQMLKKCSLVAAFRVAGLVDFTLPPAVEEMGVPVADGYRTLTQPQVDAYEPQESDQEATLGEVSATPHQVDMTPFRKKYFALLKDSVQSMGLSFPDNEPERSMARRSWQADELEIQEPVSEWTPGIYADAYGKIAALKASFAAAHSTEPDDFVPESEPVDGMSEGEVEKEHEAQEAFAEEQEEPKENVHALLFWGEASTRFENDDAVMEWITTTISQKPLEEWSVTEWAIATAEVCKLPELPNDVPDPPQGEPDWEKVKADAEAEEAKSAREANPEYQKARKEYQESLSGVFSNPADIETWQEFVTGERFMSKFTTEQFIEASIALVSLKKDREEMEPFNRDGLLLVYLEEIKGGFDSAQEMTDFQHEATGKHSFQDFALVDVRKALIMLRARKARQTPVAEIATEVTEDFTIEDQEPKPEPPIAPQADIPFLITDDTVKEIGEALLKFPGLKYKTIKSKAFREFAFKAIEHEYTGIRKILDTDGRLILDALDEELAAIASKDSDPFGFNAESDDPDAMTTENQMEEIKTLIKVMPERFHQSIGSAEFQALVGKVIGRAHRGGFGTVSAGEAAKVIARMKEIIQKEANE